MEERFGELKGLMRGLTKSIDDHQEEEKLDRKVIVDSLTKLHEDMSENSKRLTAIEHRWNTIKVIARWVTGILTTLGLGWMTTKIGK
jgi:F0F1-type ATP synthase assembly protein I